MSFIFYVILQFILYSIFIFLVHTVFHYIKDNYTTQKEVNLVKIQQEQYKDMMQHLTGYRNGKAMNANVLLHEDFVRMQLDRIKMQDTNIRPFSDQEQMILYQDPQMDTRFLEDSLIDVLIQEGGL
jgi:hypothetical protein